MTKEGMINLTKLSEKQKNLKTIGFYNKVSKQTSNEQKDGTLNTRTKRLSELNGSTEKIRENFEKKTDSENENQQEIGPVENDSNISGDENDDVRKL